MGGPEYQGNAGVFELGTEEWQKAIIEIHRNSKLEMQGEKCKPLAIVGKI